MGPEDGAQHAQSANRYPREAAVPTGSQFGPGLGFPARPDP
jgi:hypothetical protein